MPAINPQPTSNRTTTGIGSRHLIALTVLCFLGWSASAQQRAIKAPTAQVATSTAQTTAVPAQSLQINQGQAAPVMEAPSQTQTLHLLVGHSLVITSPTRIKRVSIADPSIAEAIVISPYQVLVNGKKPGGVSLIIWDQEGQTENFDLSVDLDILGLSQKIHQAFPGEAVQIETSGKSVVLSGKVSSAAVADKILAVVKTVTPNVTSLIRIPTPPAAEISLQVRFAEVNRTALTQLGANFIRNFGSNMPMSVTTQQFSPPGISTTQSVTSNGSTSTTSTSGNDFTLSNLLNIAIFRPDINLDVFIQALQEHNLLEILAEPDLLTESGKPASFLAGGQFPYPVPQTSGGAGGFTTITIQFKEFGVRLNFTPTLLPDGLIHLKVQPEVSSLDFTNALQLNGFLIPALSINRVTSEMDLKDGQSFAVAGLLDNRVTKQLEKIPGIGDIPILGKLFQSKALNKSKSELLVVVTPHIVHPLAAGTVLPGPVFPEPFLPSAKTTAAKSKGGQSTGQTKAK